MNEPQELSFPPISPESHHTCQSRREGDWIIFTCNQCPDYMRRFNWKTREMSVRDSNPEIQHSGTHLPLGSSAALLNPN